MTDAGLYCAAGDFHIDPWQPVARALITHAHGDHARRGSAAYLAAAAGLPLLRARLGADATHRDAAATASAAASAASTSRSIRRAMCSAARRSASPARRGTTVVSGDYKLAPDPTCAPFEPVRCDVFVTESTFGLPIFRWDAPDVTMRAIAELVDGQPRGRRRERAVRLRARQGAARCSPAWRRWRGALPGPIYCHGAVERVNAAYRDAGVALPPTRAVAERAAPIRAWSDALVLAPPSAQGTRLDAPVRPLSRRAFASGWMAIRGTRRRRNLDRGFVLSDHADWPALNAAIAASGAADVLRDARLQRRTGALAASSSGTRAERLDTRFEGEAGADRRPPSGRRSAGEPRPSGGSSLRRLANRAASRRVQPGATATDSESRYNRWFMQFLADYFPLLLFFVAFKWQGIYVATGVAIARRSCRSRGSTGSASCPAVHWLSFAIIVVFGGATLLLQDETFIKWKPTVLYALFGADAGRRQAAVPAAT